MRDRFTPAAIQKDFEAHPEQDRVFLISPVPCTLRLWQTIAIQ